jgi:imidazolonepropionase-like amidohydrolase
VTFFAAKRLFLGRISKVFIKKSIFEVLETLKAININLAVILGISNRVGSIDKGKYTHY